MTFGKSDPERIAILKPCCLGDCIMALPAIDAMIAAWTSSHIDVYVGAHSQSAFSFRPSLQARRIPDSLDWRSTLRLARMLRQRRYDTVITLDRSRLLKLATRLAGAHLTASVKTDPRELRHEADVYLDVVRGIGLPALVTVPIITPSIEASQRAESLLATYSMPVAILHPGGAHNPGAKMPGKRWPADRYVAIARQLRGDGVSVLLSGGADDVELATEIAGAAGIAESAILAGKADIETLAAILDRASVFVGPDTGVSHIAAAIGTPTIAIFGPTNPLRYRPLGTDVVVLAPATSWELPDRDLRGVSDEAGSISTELVSVEAVLDAARSAIDRGRRPRPCSD